MAELLSRATQSIADPLIDVSDYGMKAASVRELFAALRARLVPIVRAITSRAARRRLVPASSSRPTDAAARVRARGDPRVRLRLRARPPGPDAPPVHDQVLARRRAHHHARARERSHRRAVQDAARVRPRALRAGHPHGVRGHAARERHVVRRAREPVAPVGEPRRPQPRLLGALLSRAADGVPARSCARCRSTRSTARSTRSSAR